MERISSTNEFPDTDLLESIAADLRVDASFIEKDWHATHLLALISRIDDPLVRLAFSGGTSLSKGYRLIERFSEDLDFKLETTDGETPPRPQRRAYRRKVIAAIEDSAEWKLLPGQIVSRNQSRYFCCLIEYSGRLTQAAYLRPHIKLEMSFAPTSLPTEQRPLQSFVGQARGLEPEIPSMACVSPVETAADKLSALTWRVLSRNRSEENDDPTLIRHLHDLAALESLASASGNFGEAARKALRQDKHRGAFGDAPETPFQHVSKALNMLAEDSTYRTEYDDFVVALSYAQADQVLSYDDALKSICRLAKLTKQT